MDPVATTGAPKTNGESSLHELFALSDEQILEIEPEPHDPTPTHAHGVILSAAKNLSLAGAPGELSQSQRDSSVASLPQNDEGITSARDSDHPSPVASHATLPHQGDRAQTAVPLEPPPWLAAQMKDPWGGEEAREFWDGVQQARQEAAASQAYRAAFASPEDARALKELYPGGVTEARAAADRARMLEEIDRAYFGAAGNSPEQLSASRAQLAQQMLREDPAAFREMVAAGLQALQAAEQGSSGAANGASLPRLAQVFAASRSDAEVAPPLRATSAAAGSPQTPTDAGLKPSATSAPHESRVTSHESLSAYAAFERAANEDLEHSVGTAIERTLEQALPVAQPFLAVRAGAGKQERSPAIRERLSASVRIEVEKALQGDRQLGEQVAQILASRRFDNEARAQVVRLIGERAQQLVPGAAKRVLNEWTQTTLAAHRGRTQRNDVAVDLAPTRSGQSLDWPGRSKDRPLPSPRPVNYRKLSDEQILDL
jgi:hypothetical protein